MLLLHFTLAVLAAPTLMVLIFNVMALLNKSWSRRKEGRMLILYACMIPIALLFASVLQRQYAAHNRPAPGMRAK